MKSFVYVCSKCGYDTASYERCSRCPNCHDHKHLHLIGMSDDEDIKQKLTILNSEPLHNALKKILA